MRRSHYLDDEITRKFVLVVIGGLRERRQEHTAASVKWSTHDKKDRSAGSSTCILYSNGKYMLVTTAGT